MGRAIRFYLVNDSYGEFSNFAPFAIEIAGRVWPTSEHFFQAQKFAGTEHEEQIRLAETPMKAANMGRDRHRPLHPDWEQAKDDVMRQAIKAKFSQHPELRSLLISTGTAELIENTKNDSYWGDGGDGTGRNMLGKILMEERNTILTSDD